MPLLAKESLCKAFFKEGGACPEGPACPNAHSTAEILGFKSQMCAPFKEKRCDFGDLCTLAHTEAELRRKQCRPFSEAGFCHFGDRCNYEHSGPADPAGPGSGARTRRDAAPAPKAMPTPPKPPAAAGALSSVDAWPTLSAGPAATNGAGSSTDGRPRDPAAANPRWPPASASPPVLDAFERREARAAALARGAAGTGKPISLPVSCLRWTHDAINAHMVFGEGRSQDKSVYDLVHELFSGRLSTDELPPLEVVLDGDRLFSLSNRRLAALKMYQALRQHEAVTVACEVYLASDPRRIDKYKKAKTTTPDLGDGLGVRPHTDCKEARHMGSPLFRHANEFCANLVEDEEEEGGRARPPAVGPERPPDAPPTAAPAEPPRRFKAPPSEVPLALAAVSPAHPPPRSKAAPAGESPQVPPPLQSVSGEAAPSGGPAAAPLPPQHFKAPPPPPAPLDLGAAARAPEKSRPAVPPSKFKNPPAANPGGALPPPAGVSELPSKAPPSKAPPDMWPLGPALAPLLPAPTLPAVQGVTAAAAATTWSGPVLQGPPPPPPKDPPRWPQDSVPEATGEEGEDAPVPVELARGEESAGVFHEQLAIMEAGAAVEKALEAAGSAEAWAGELAAALRGPCQSSPQVRAILEGYGWHGDRFDSPPGRESLLRALRAAQERAIPQSVAEDAEGLVGPPPAHPEPRVRTESDENDALLLGGAESDDDEEEEGVALAAVVGGAALEHAIGVVDAVVKGEVKQSSDIDNSLERLAVGSEALRAVLQMHGWGGKEFMGQPDWTQLLRDLETAKEEDREGASEGAGLQYEEEATLKASMDQQTDVKKIGDLKDRLVFGTFRCTSGSDFKGRRSRGELLVEQGPKALLGCRVHIIGQLNRNRAWHFDHCWARITLAKVGQAGEGATLQTKWDANSTEKTALYGKVVRAQKSLVPRQELVVCLRSKIVRTMTSMVFRVINGKFPLIKVPWDMPDPPNLWELHVVQVTHWNKELPVGTYVQRLSNHSMDQSILRAVQLSLNFCDWEDVTQDRDSDAGWPKCSAPSAGPKRRDMRNRFAATVSIEHEDWPASFAMSLPREGSRLYLHVADVNAYLDSSRAPMMEETLRQRAVGAWFLDYLDRPIPECLPLFPPEVGKDLGFQVGVPTMAMTFEFEVESGSIKLESGQHYESIVQCSHRYTFDDAEEVLRSPDSAPHPDRPILRPLLKYARNVARSLEGQGCADLLEHLEHDFAKPPSLEQAGEWRGCVMASEIVAACSYIVNRYAGGALADAKLWRQLFLEPGKLAASAQVMPLHVRAKPDPIAVRGAQRLLMQTCPEPLAPGDPLMTEHVVKAIRHILGKPNLSPQQAQCLQAAFQRQLRGFLPFSGYLSAAKAPPQREGAPDGALFRRDTKIFHVASPLRRYLDILGMRALKAKSGWRPAHPELLLTPARLEEAIWRTNMRQDAARFAVGIYRQITLMRELDKGGWKIDRAVVSHVAPSMLEVLVPLPAKAGLPLSLPVSALRGASCTVEYLSEEQALRVVCYAAHELTKSRHARGEWMVTPWGGTQLSCVVTRNFAQPARHHASMSSIILSDITVNASVTTSQRVDLTVGVGHRMFPELFSTWPDLKDWYNVDRDIYDYTQVWHAIRLCQTHAAAALGSVYTERTSPPRLDWFDQGAGSNRTTHCQCKLQDVQLKYGDRIVSEGDVAIIRCSSSAHKEAVLYGTVVQCKPMEIQDFTQMCARRGCDQVTCRYAHSEEEKRNPRFLVEIKLSEISKLAKDSHDEYGRWIEARGTRVLLQFINIPLADRRNLDQLLRIPGFARANAVSPVLAFLVGVRSEQTRRAQQELRALADTTQVLRAMSYPHISIPHTAPQLNTLQKRGVMEALQRPFSIVQGPPGTGKTTFLVHLVVSLLNLEADPQFNAARGWSTASRQRGPSQRQQVGKILLCAPSNQAANEVLHRLLKDTNIPRQYITRIYARSIEAANGSKYKGGLHLSGREDFRIASHLDECSLHSRTRPRPEVQARQHHLSRANPNPAAQREYDMAYEREEAVVLKEARIVVTTCTSACSHSSIVKEDKMTRFATVIIDEAAQATEPDVLLPAMLADHRVVLVGDHKQLGPVITQNNLCRAYLGALEVPMIERLYNSPHLLPTNTMLEKQYRMHGSIRSFPSKQFYDDQLRDAESIQVHGLEASVWPKTGSGEHVVFVDCRHSHKLGLVTEVGQGRSRGNTTIENNTSLMNSGEAMLVALACERLFRAGCRPEQVAVITPYRAQQDEIRKLLERRLPKVGNDVTVGTVYSLQGSEREFIILSFVRSTAEGVALNQNVYATGPDDIVVAGKKDDAALRQICESHLGIVSNCKLLNVSLTRAKHGLVIIGNREVLAEGSQDFLELMAHLAERECILSEQAFRNLRG